MSIDLDSGSSAPTTEEPHRLKYVDIPVTEGEEEIWAELARAKTEHETQLRNRIDAILLGTRESLAYAAPEMQDLHWISLRDAIYNLLGVGR